VLFLGLLGGLLVGWFVGSVLGLVDGLVLGLVVWLVLGLILGLIVGPIGGLVFGWRVYLTHYILRFLLWRYGYTPQKYILFLNHASDLIFLRNVGGGYIFIHRLVLEHFAEMDVDEFLAEYG